MEDRVSRFGDVAELYESTSEIFVLFHPLRASQTLQQLTAGCDGYVTKHDPCQICRDLGGDSALQSEQRLGLGIIRDEQPQAIVIVGNQFGGRVKLIIGVIWIVDMQTSHRLTFPNMMLCRTE
jgi:hypothetical protein